MATEVVMPAMEMAQDSGKLIRWLKDEGEFVHQGEPLMEIETDKVTVEIEAPTSGILFNIKAQSGDEVPVGQVIAFLLDEDEELPVTTGQAQELDTPHAGEGRPVRATPVARRLAEDYDLDPADIPFPVGVSRMRKDDVLAYMRAEGSQGRPPEVIPRLKAASPKARRLSTEHSLDLATLVGSGPEGAVLSTDVQAALAEDIQTYSVEIEQPEISREYTAVPIQGLRKVIADRLQASYQTAPHITLTLSVDMTEALRLLARLEPIIQADKSHRLTITTVLAKIIGTTLMKHPRLNAHLVEGEIRQFSTVHLGIAVALDDGLIVPVIRHIENKGLSAIQTEIRDLTKRARASSLKPSEVSGSTFSLSNLGMFGIEQFTAILNPPEVGILAVGVVKNTPVEIDNEVVLRPMMQLTLNCDHRAVDGAVAAAFLRALRQSLENPYLLLN